MTTFNIKRKRLRTVDVALTITSVGHLMRNVPDGLWQQLKRTSVISGKKFPIGSNIVMIMYELDGNKLSGAIHLEELPNNIREVVEVDGLWKSPDTATAMLGPLPIKEKSSVAGNM